MHGIEHEFNPGGDSQLIEDAKQILFNGMLAEVQLVSHFAITHAFRDYCYYLFFAGGEQLPSTEIYCAQGRNLRDEIQQEVQLLGIGPYLTIRDPLDAPA